jgi:hypothetical protein
MHLAFGLLPYRWFDHDGKPFTRTVNLCSRMTLGIPENQAISTRFTWDSVNDLFELPGKRIPCPIQSAYPSITRGVLILPF